MAKGGAKVQQDDELDELSYDDLVEMLNDADEFMTKEKAKLKDLKLKFTSLQDSYEELKTSHENLKEKLMRSLRKLTIPCLIMKEKQH